MMVSRREFLTQAGAVGAGAVAFSAGGFSAASAEDFRPSGNVVFERVKTGGLSLLSYFVGDKRSGKAVVIDPRRDVDVFVELARKHGLTITHALETHIHADFVSGSRELADRTGTAAIHASVEGGAKYGFQVEPLRHGNKVELGSVTLTTLFTPGHTPEHVSFLATERGAEARPWGLFTGDFLFVDSIGRPDLLGKDNTQRLAKQLFHSVRTAYKDVPGPIPLHPAHGAGSPCGANIGDRDSTLGYEREHSRALQFQDETRFVNWVLFTAPPIPHYYPRMKLVNAAGPEVLKGLPKVEWYSAKGFRHLLAEGGVQLVDNRSMLSFGGGHVAGALNIGPKPDLSLWAGWMLDPEKPIALVLGKDDDLAEVVRQFVRVGFTKFAGALRGGMEGWITEGLPIDTLPQMGVNQVRSTFPTTGMQLLDIRLPQEWDAGHLPGARYIFLPELPRKLDTLDRSKPVVVYCASGYRSSIGSSLLKAQGFNVFNVPGSYKAWTAAGYPVERPAAPGRGTDTVRN